MGLRDADAVCGCWTGLKGFNRQWVVSSLESLGHLWLPLKLAGLKALLWSPGEKVQSGIPAKALRTVSKS